MTKVTTTSEASHGDEVQENFGLLSLIAVLARRWRLIAMLMLVFALIGPTFAMMRVPAYRYTTTIQIGSRYEQDRVLPIETAAETAKKLTSVIIPQEVGAKEFLSTYVSIADGPLVNVETVGPKKLQPQVEDLHKRLLSSVKENHTWLVGGQKLELHAQEQLIQQRIEKTNREFRDVVEEQRLTMQKLEAEANSDRGGNTPGQIFVLSWQNLRDDMARRRLSMLSDRLEELNKQQGRIAFASASFRDTAAVRIAVPSERPIGIGWDLALVLGLLSGLIVGMAVVLLLELGGMLNRYNERAPPALG